MSKSIATAADVRNWLVAHPKSLARLSPQAQATVLPNAEGNFPKGRLAQAAYVTFNKGQRKAEYVLGNTREVGKAEAKAAKQARQAAARKAARKGATVGTRGPLPKAFIVTPKG